MDLSCNLECMTESCNYQNLNENCISECLSTGCTSELLFNNQCDDACNTAICGWDYGSCGFCSPGCYIEDLISCPANCDVAQCSHTEFCASGQYCSPGCKNNMVGDGVCNLACYNAECQYDNNDCNCPPLCLNLSICNFNCITPYCKYSSAVCETGEIVRTLVNSLLTGSSVWDPAGCIAINSSCIYLMLNSQCDPQCNVQQCLYDLGGCSVCSDVLCVNCVGNVCVKCIKGYYSLMGKCVLYVPQSFSIHSDFPYFLIPQTDISTISNPNIIYVSPVNVSAIQDGSISNPYTSLSVALASIWCKYTIIYLLDGYHYLYQTDLSMPQTVYTSSGTMPLSSSIGYNYIKISTLLCSDNQTSSCASTPAIVFYMDTEVQLIVKNAATLDIENVIFDGRFSLNFIYENQVYSYCPYYTVLNSVYYNDKGQPIDINSIPTNCGKNSENTFLRFDAGGQLALKNVTFMNFQQQFRAVIDISRVFATFINTSFLYTQSSSNPGSAVIVQNTGSLVWIQGLVKFLNYGYEYTQNINFSPFLYTLNTKNIQLQYLEFDWNVAFSSGILVINSIQMFILEYSVIKSGGITSVDSKNGLIYIFSIYLSSVYSGVVITNVQFVGNQGEGATGIYIQGVSFATLSGVSISPSNYAYQTPSENFIETSRSLGYYIQNSDGLVFGPCSSLISIQNILWTVKLAYIQIQDSYCTNLISAYNNHLIQITYSNFKSNIVENSVLEIDNNTSTSVLTTVFHNNSAYQGSIIYYSLLFPSSFNLIYAEFSFNLAIKGIIYISNQGALLNPLDLLLNFCVFTSNQATSGTGLYVESNSLSSSSQINNTQFQYNQASFLGVLVLYENPISISNSQFSYNIAYQGVVIYIYKESPNYSNVTMSTCLISNNKGKSIIYLESINIPPTLIIESTGLINNTGYSICMYNSYLYVNNSMFVGNTYIEGPCLMSSSSVSYITNCNIEYNYGEINGAFKITENSFILCNNCIFYTNYAKYGGAIIFTSGGYGNITNSKFINNVGIYYGPSIYAVSTSVNLIYVEGSEFIQNLVGISGMISLIQSSGMLVNCNITENISIDFSPGISTSMSNLTVISCRFFNQSGLYGSFISMATLSYSEIYNSQFELASAGEGGSIVVATSKCLISSCTFKHSSAVSGGTISINTSGVLIMINVYIYNSTGTSLGGMIYNTESTLICTSCKFDLFSDSGIYADKAPLIQLDGVVFSNGHSNSSGGGIMCISCASILIYDSYFVNMSSVQGGSLAIFYQNNQPKPICVIRNSSFVNSDGAQGGAIYTSDYNLTITDSYFFNNTALTDIPNVGSGGAIFYSCEYNAGCNLYSYNNTFKNNYATTLGGSISWDEIKPELISNTYINNTAIYGNNIASFAISIKLLISDKIYDNYTLIDVPPGQKVDQTLLLVLVDHYGQIVKTENSTTVALVSNNSDNILSGSTVQKAVNGMATFDNFYIYGNPNTNLTVQISSPSIDTSQSVSIFIKLRNCILGETFSNKACVSCDKGQYSIDPTGPCLECLPEAVCYGNYTMVPKSGYWRSSIYSTTFYQCPLLESCIGGGNNLSLTGECKEGYSSNMCQPCDLGYSHSAGNLCQKCPDMNQNIIYLCLIAIAIVACTCLLVYVNIALADKPASNYTILIKILMNYIQVISIVSSFNLDWPDFALQYLHIQQAAGSLSQQSFSLDCFISAKYDHTNTQVYFDKILLYLLIPIALILICLFLWGIVSLIKLDYKYIRNHFTGSVVIVLFILHTIIINITLSPFSCKEIDNIGDWLNDNLSIKCWEGTHELYTLAIALPGIVIWGICIPGYGIIVTYKNRHRIEELEIKQRYGFITAGYKNEHYYWEFVIIYRKVLVISCSLFFGSLSVQLQTLSVLIVLLLASYLQSSINPFATPELNKMEFWSIIVSVVTIYCGLYYLTPDITFNARVILFIILMVFNSIFFGYWLYFFVKDFTKSAIEFILDLCKKKVQVEPEIISSKEAVPIINSDTSENQTENAKKNNKEEGKNEYIDTDNQEYLEEMQEIQEIKEGTKVKALATFDKELTNSVYYAKSYRKNMAWSIVE